MRVVPLSLDIPDDLVVRFFANEAARHDCEIGSACPLCEEHLEIRVLLAGLVARALRARYPGLVGKAGEG